MTKLFKFKQILSVLMVALVLVTWNSCKKEDDQPPELPPADALLMDFSYFDDGVPQGKKSVASYNNFGYSVVTVGLFNTAALANIVIPVAAYAEALHHEAVYLGDNSWQWLYSVTIGQATFTVKLISDRISNEEFTLRMYVDKSGEQGFENFKWLEGTVRYDRTSANWTLYESPDVTWPVVDIEWTMDWEKELYSIKYVCLKPDTDLHGSIIEHGVTEDPVYNAYYNIIFPSNTVMIKWNTTTKAGRVQSSSYFGNTDWHCWDENLLDADCQ